MTIQGFEQRICISNPLFRFPRRMMIMLNEEQQQAWWLMLVAVRSFHSRVFPPLLYIHVYVYIFIYIYIYIYMYISLSSLSSCFSRGVDRGRELDPIAQRSGFLERQWRCCWSVCKRREKKCADVTCTPHCFQQKELFKKPSPLKVQFKINHRIINSQEFVLEQWRTLSFHLPLTLDLQLTILKLSVNTVLKPYYYTKKKRNGIYKTHIYVSGESGHGMWRWGWDGGWGNRQNREHNSGISWS